MQVYDTVNKLAKEIRESEEYINFKMAKQAIDLNPDLKNKISEFEKARYQQQIDIMQTGKTNEEKIKEVQDIYTSIIETEEGRNHK